MRRFVHKPSGWNTWDYRGFNRLVYLNRGRTTVSVKYAIWDEHVRPTDPQSRKLGELYEGFRWEHALRIGCHGPLGLPARLEFVAGRTSFEAEASAEDGVLSLAVRPLVPSRQRIVFLFEAPEGESLVVQPGGGGVFAGWGVELHGATWPASYYLNLPAPYAIGLEGEPASLVVRPRRQRGARPKTAATGDGGSSGSPTGDGALGEAPEAMARGVSWNTLYDSRRRLVCSPVCRDWCIDWCGPIVFCWDSFFAAVMAACASRELARRNIEAALAAVDELGFVPNYYMAHGAASRDRSMPCLGAYAVWKIEGAHPEREWLQKVYPRLRRWHRFWKSNRSSCVAGLLAWGTNAAPRYAFPQLLPYNPSLQHTAKCAMYEAGLDNSPMYDGVAFNPQTSTLDLADVMLNSCYALDCAALSLIAGALGRTADASAYAREYDQMRRAIEEHLWDEAHGIYANRHPDGTFSSRWSPTSFLPLLAGVADPARADRLVREHLLNESEFWGEYVIPSIARNDPAYADNDYWRGRIWGPFNYLIAEGLRRYHYDSVSADLAYRGLDIFLRNWREDGGIYENYNAENGKGGDVWNAARLYHWGGLLALAAMGELLDAEWPAHLRFGSLHFPDAAVRDVQLAGSRYSVSLGPGVHVERNGEVIVDCSSRAVLRFPFGSQADAPIEASVGESGSLKVWKTFGAARMLRIGDGRTVHPVEHETYLEYTWKGAG